MAGYLEVYQNPSVGVCELPFTDNIDLPFLAVEILIYPNPALDHVVFELTDEAISTLTDQTAIFITDIFGRLVHEVRITDQKLVWDTRSVAPGVYLYQINNGKYVNSGKFLIVK